jgi:hypothetical protein
MKTIKAKFTFKVVQPNDKAGKPSAKFLETKAAFDAANIKYTTASDGSIKRDAVECHIPEYEVSEVPETFLKTLISDAVYSAVQADIINGLKATELAAALSIQQVIDILATTGKSQLDKADVESLASFVDKVQSARGSNAATRELTAKLIKGRFMTATLNANAINKGFFEPILNAVVGYVSANDESGQPVLSDELYTRYASVLEVLTTNLANWLEVEATKTQVVDISL